MLVLRRVLNALLAVTEPLNVLVACGPYTPSDSLTFDPLLDLISVIIRDRPDVCLMVQNFILWGVSVFFFCVCVLTLASPLQLGPFVDSRHEQIEVRRKIYNGYTFKTFLTALLHIVLWQYGGKGFCLVWYVLSPVCGLERPGDRDLWSHFLQMHWKHRGWNEKVCHVFVHLLTQWCGHWPYILFSWVPKMQQSWLWLKSGSNSGSAMWLFSDFNSNVLIHKNISYKPCLTIL